MKRETTEQTIKNVGERLKNVRHYLRMTQRQVAEETNTSVLTVSKVENGNAVRSNSFIRLMCFYAQYISVDCLLAKDFSVANAENSAKCYHSMPQ